MKQQQYERVHTETADVEERDGEAASAWVGGSADTEQQLLGPAVDVVDAQPPSSVSSSPASCGASPGCCKASLLALVSALAGMLLMLLLLTPALRSRLVYGDNQPGALVAPLSQPPPYFPPTLSPSQPTVLAPISLNECRLLSVLQRLQRGFPTRMAAMGGSITRHVLAPKGWLEHLTSRLQAKFPVTLSTDTTDLLSPSNTSAPTTLSVDEARQAIHTQSWKGDASLHLSSNRALSACSSSFASTCMSTLWPDGELGGADILFLEFGVNDAAIVAPVNSTAGSHAAKSAASGKVVDSKWLDELAVLGFANSGGEGFDPASNMERLLRYALSSTVGYYPDVASVTALDGPAVVLVNFCFHDGVSAQEAHAAAAHHYNAPLVSICELFPYLFPKDDPRVADKLPQWKNLYMDQTHPNVVGHAMAAAMISDRLLSFGLRARDPLVQQQCDVYRVQSEPAVAAAAAPTFLPAPLFPINAGTTDWRCTWGSFRPGDSKLELVLGGAERFDSMKIHQFNISSNDGNWTYQDETRSGKWGWQTNVIGARISFVLQPNTQRLALAYLRSRTTVGAVSAWVTATYQTTPPLRVEGERHRVEAWWDQRVSTFELASLPASVLPAPTGDEDTSPALLELHMQLLEPSEAMRTFQKSPENAQASNKFKLVSFMES